jgi:hypothetical protein
MNSMTELLLPELAVLRMADRQAEAAAERLARDLRRVAGPRPGWTLTIRIRLPFFGRGAAKPA